MDTQLQFGLEVRIEAHSDRVWETLTKEMSKWWISGQSESGMNLQLECWPGGRLYRNLGEGVGHFWAHVQVIKPPRLLELVGPMFTSLPVVHHARFLLTEQGSGTLVRYEHQTLGKLPQELRDNIAHGTEVFVLQSLKQHIES